MSVTYKYPVKKVIRDFLAMVERDREIMKKPRRIKRG